MKKETKPSTNSRLTGLKSEEKKDIDNSAFPKETKQQKEMRHNPQKEEVRIALRREITAFFLENPCRPSVKLFGLLRIQQTGQILFFISKQF